MTGILIRTEKFGCRDTDTWGEGHRETRQELGWCSYKPKHDKDCHQPTEARRGRTQLFSTAFGGSMALQTPWFLTSNLWENKCLCCKLPCLWSYVRKLTQKLYVLRNLAGPLQCLPISRADIPPATPKAPCQLVVLSTSSDWLDPTQNDLVMPLPQVLKYF